MERSAELEAVTRRLWDAVDAGEMATAMAFVSSSEPDILWWGTDPGERWTDHAEMSAIFQAQADELGGGFPLRIRDVDAWTEGTVGWSTAIGELTVDDLAQPQFRVATVWHMELGQWRAVSVVASLAIANEESLGVTLTTSIELVAQAVEVERPDLRSATAPDGTVTLLFTDIEGSTERNQVLGDRDWMQVLRGHHDLIREQVAAHDGFEVKSMGDGFMIAFSSARKALRCAMDIQRAIAKEDDLDVRVRAGLHAGEAVRDGDDFYGATVNMAARVAGQAEGGEVLVSSLVKALVESSGEFTFDEPRTAELKGIPGSHKLYPLAL